MSTAAQQPDPRREHLRRQAIIRRQRVLERLSATRMLLVGGAVAATCVLAGYMDASAHVRSTSSTTGSGSGFASTGSGYGNSGANSYGGSSSQDFFGGGSPPSSASGGGSVVSGGS